MSLVKKFANGGSSDLKKKEPIKYKFQTDQGDIELDKEKLQEEVLNTPYYQSLDESNKLKFRQELEDLYDKAASTGNIRITSTGPEVSGLYGTEGAYGLGYKTKEEIDAIKNRKERRAAKAEYNRRMDANMAFSQAILNLGNKERALAEENLNKERASKREQSLQGLENIRGYFPYKYGKNQLGAGTGNYSLNEATIMKELIGDDAKRAQELSGFAKANKDYILGLDESDEELGNTISDRFDFSLSNVKQQLVNLDPNKQEDAIKIFELTKNAVKPRWMWDKNFYNTLAGEDTQQQEQEVNRESVPSEQKTELQNQEREADIERLNPQEDVYDIARNKYIFGGKQLSYKDFYDSYKSDTPFGQALREQYPDFIQKTKTIIPGVNSNLVDINVAKKNYGEENTILPLFRGFSHINDITNQLDIKDPNVKIIKAANEGVIRKNPYSNVQDSTYAFAVKRDKDGNVRKYNVKESKNEFGEYVYTYTDENGKVQTIIAKKRDTPNDKYSPFRFDRVYGFKDIPAFFKEGGEIPKYQYGGSLSFGDDEKSVLKQEEQYIPEDTIQGKKASEHRASLGEVFDPNYKLSTADKLEVTSLLSDVASLGLGLTGVGSVPGAIAGALGSATGYAADVNREGVTLGNTAGLIGNLGLDVVSAIPIAGNLAKGPKMVKWAKRASKLLTAYGLGNATFAAKKIIEDPLNATAEDYQSLVNGLRSIVGGRKQMGDVSRKTIKTETVIKAKNGPDGKVVDIKLNPQQTEKLNTLSSSDDKINFLKEVAKPHFGNDVKIDNIGIMPTYGGMKLQAPISIKERSIKSPVTREIEYSRTKKVISPVNKEDIAKVKSSEGKWDFDYINSKGESKQIKLSPIYKGYKKVFGIPTANKLESARVKEEAMRLIGSPKVYKKKQALYSDKVVKNPEYYQSKEAFVKQHPEYAGKSEEEIIDAMTVETNKMNFVKTMQEAKKSKAEKIKKLNEEVEALNKNESEKAERFTKYIKKEVKKDDKKIIDSIYKRKAARDEAKKRIAESEEKKEIADAIYKRKVARKQAERRIERTKEKKELAETIAERKETREKAKKRLKEYKKNVDEKAKEAAGKKAKTDRDKEIAEYKRKKSQNKTIGKEIAEREAKRRASEKKDYKKLSNAQQEKLENATQGRNQRKKIVKRQFGGEVNFTVKKPTILTGNKYTDMYLKNVSGQNKITTPEYSLTDYSKDVNTQLGIDAARKPLLSTKYDIKPKIGSQISNTLKSLGSKIDPLTVSEAGRALASIISNRKQDTKHDVALASNPAEVYLRETGIGASGIADKEANRLINTSRDNLTSDAKLNYLISQDLANKAGMVRERGLQQDREVAMNKTLTNLEKAGQYASNRANTAYMNANAIANAKNAQRTMENQIKFANAGILDTFWSSQNMKQMQKKATLDAYDKALNEQFVNEEYERKLEPYTRAYDKLGADPKATQEQLLSLRKSQEPALRKLNIERIKQLRDVISGNYTPQYKKGGSIGLSDYFKIDNKTKEQVNDYFKEMRGYNMKKNLIFYRSSLINKKK